MTLPACLCVTGPRSAKPISSRSAAASPAQPSPAATRSSGRRSSKQGTGVAAAAASPVEPLASPHTRNSRRSSTGSRAAAIAPAVAGAELQTPPAAVAGAAAAADSVAKHPQHAQGYYAPSQEPTPSPLRRITRSMSSPLVPSPMGLTEELDLGGAGGGRRSRRSTLNRYADQQNKWGFVPGEEDTMMIDMNLPGGRHMAGVGGS